MYVCVRTEKDPEVWTVGFYDPGGFWNPLRDYNRKSLAEERVSYLNGGLHPDLCDKFYSWLDENTPA